MAEASATIPATYSALKMAEEPAVVISLSSLVHFQETDQASMYSTTPAYPQLRARFYRLFQNVIQGGNVASELADAKSDMTTVLRQYQLISVN